MTTRNIHLSPDTTTFHAADRGLLCKSAGEHTTTHFYVPRVGQVKVTTLGRNTTVYLGTTMMLTMSKSMWASHEDGIMSAALGPNWDADADESETS